MKVPSDNPDETKQGQEPLRIALVDDHELLVGGLVQALSEKPQLAEVAGYQNSARLIEDIKLGGHFDVVITDMLMGEVNGLTLARDIRDRFQVPVLLMTGVETPPSRAELDDFGIVGFVHKSAPIEVLYDAILAVGGGKSCFFYPDGWDQEKGSLKFGRQNHEGSQRAGEIALSERQTEVLKLVAAGAANKEIASNLAITENTVKTHLKHIFSALGVTKRTACVQAAKSFGLLD